MKDWPDCSYLRNHILWDSCDLKGWFNLSRTSKLALPQWVQPGGHAKSQKLGWTMPVAFLVGTSVYGFLLNQENYLSAFVFMIIFIYSEVCKHTKREGRWLCEGNHYSAEVKLSAATKAETLFSSLLLPPLSSGLKKMESWMEFPRFLQIVDI